MDPVPVALPAVRPRPRVRASVALGFVAAYLVLDWLSYIHPVAPYAFTPWNPPPGLSLALLLGFGLHYSPLLLVATFIAEVVVHDPAGSLPQKFAYALILTAGYTLMAAWLLRRARFDPRFGTVRDLSVFVATVAVGTALIAMLYVGAHVVTGEFAWAAWRDFIPWFWVGDAIGIVVLTPFLLVHVRRPRTVPLRVTAEGLAQTAALVTTLALVFSAGDAAAARYFYLLFLPLIWVSMRHGFEGATAALFALQLGLIAALQLADYASSSALELQMLMLALAVTGLFLGMVVSEWRRAGRALAGREAELKTVVATAPDGILTIDDDGAVLAMNQAGLALFGRAAGNFEPTPVQRFLPDLPAALHEARALETRALTARGDGFPVEVSIGSAPHGGGYLHIAIVRDMSQRKAIEERLRERDRELNRALRLAAAAEMASALAHELHQPLTAATTYVQACDLMLARAGHRDGVLFDTMRKAVTEVRRAGEVVRRLRDFYRAGTLRVETVQVAELCHNALHTLHNRVERQGVTVVIDLPPGLPAVRVDRVQLELVMHNLLANAMDSLASGPVAAPRIEVRGVRRDADFVQLAVEDWGPGVPDATAHTLFEAFATSKPEGMGMGLAISRSIVEQHGGRLWLERGSGGALFVLTLPITKENS